MGCLAIQHLGWCPGKRLLRRGLPRRTRLARTGVEPDARVGQGTLILTAIMHVGDQDLVILANEFDIEVVLSKVLQFLKGWFFVVSHRSCSFSTCHFFLLIIWPSLEIQSVLLPAPPRRAATSLSRSDFAAANSASPGSAPAHRRKNSS